MAIWLIWIVAGTVMALLELVLPGGIIVFLGLSAMLVGALVYFGLVTTIPMAFMSWFIVSVVMILFLRSLFMKYFEGDSIVHNVDEDQNLVGAVVVISEKVRPYKDGRVKFRDTTWGARSEEEIGVGSKAQVIKREGNVLIIKSL